MNDDVSKSFHCNEIGCQMSFYTEQTLSAHRQGKHNKLNLEIPSKDATINFSADQTPTPTRLLNKCEELRVFDDPYIQNLNPFDEGFRKAISDDPQRSGYLTTPTSNQDTLHTPQILPDFITRIVKEEKTLKNDGLLPMQDEPENLSTTPDIPKYTVNDHDHHIAEKPHQPIPLLPRPNIIYAAPLLTTAPTMHLNNPQNDNDRKANESVKDKLKNILLNNNNGTSSTSSHIDGTKRSKMEVDGKLNLPTILIQTVPLIAPANLMINSNNSNKNTDNSKLRIASGNDKKNIDVKLKPLDIKKPERETSTKKRSATTNSDNNSNNPAALKVERNRAAARRYRHKMKIQSQALRDKYDRSQKEIAQLKKEVTELKKLLLLHKDCEVTKNLSLMH